MAERTGQGRDLIGWLEHGGRYDPAQDFINMLVAGGEWARRARPIIRRFEACQSRIDCLPDSDIETLVEWLNRNEKQDNQRKQQLLGRAFGNKQSFGETLAKIRVVRR